MSIRIISGCTSGVFAADFGSLPVIGNQVYYLTFFGDTPSGCFTIGAVTSSATILVQTADSYVNSCPDCLSGNPTPTPTSSVTPTKTPTPTTTPTKTPTKTPTQTTTKTPTQTPTQTQTQTPTKTPTQTPTKTQTQTPTNTQTQTPTNTSTKTPTPTQTPTNTSTKTPTPTNTSTKTPTPTNTPTNTTTPTNTPTPSFTPFYSIEVGTEYFECVVCPDEGLTGFTFTKTTVPHPAAANAQENVTIYQMGAVAIGGPDGLNS